MREIFESQQEKFKAQIPRLTGTKRTAVEIIELVYMLNLEERVKTMVQKALDSNPQLSQRAKVEIVDSVQLSSAINSDKIIMILSESQQFC